MQNFTGSSIVRFMGATVLLFALTVKAPAAFFDYEAAAGKVPTNQNWTRTDGGFGGTQGSESISNGLLVVSDTGPNGFRTYSMNANSLTTETAWQMRARVKMQTDYTGAQPLYSQWVNDNGLGGGAYGWGTAYSNGQTWVNFESSFSVNGFGAPIGVVGNPFLDIVVTKTNGANPGGRGDDSIVLQVYTNNFTTLLGTISTTLAGGRSGFGSPSVIFGNQFGAPTGTFVLDWATFGVGELAPIVPEPSTALLGAVGMLSLVLRRRRV